MYRLDANDISEEWIAMSYQHNQADLTLTMLDKLENEVTCDAIGHEYHPKYAKMAYNGYSWPKFNKNFAATPSYLKAVA